MKMLVPLNREQSDPQMVSKIIFFILLDLLKIIILICTILELIQPPMLAEGSHSIHTTSNYSMHSTTSQYSLMPPR